MNIVYRSIGQDKIDRHSLTYLTTTIFIAPVIGAPVGMESHARSLPAKE